jgi:hypothetical protein
VRLDPVQIAVDALLGGLDSRSLRLLAGERSGAPYLAPLFEQAAEELGFGGMDVETARFILTRDIAARIISGELTELEGGRRIYEETYRSGPLGAVPDYLYDFVSTWSWIEDLEVNAKTGGCSATEVIEAEKETLREAAAAMMRMPDTWGEPDAS